MLLRFTTIIPFAQYIQTSTKTILKRQILNTNGNRRNIRNSKISEQLCHQWKKEKTAHNVIVGSSTVQQQFIIAYNFGDTRNVFSETKCVCVQLPCYLVRLNIFRDLVSIYTGVV